MWAEIEEKKRMKKKTPEKKKPAKSAPAKKAVKEVLKKAAKKAKEVLAPKATKAAKPAKAAPAPKAAPVSKATPVAAPVAPATLGQKRSCPKCSTKFYDFGKNPILCPKCGAEVDPEALLPKIPRKAEQKKKSADKVAESVLAGDEAGGEVEIETADDLVGDDDDTAMEELVVDDDSDDEF